MRNSSAGRVIAAPGSTRAPRRSGVHNGRFALRQCRVRDRHCPAQGPTAASASSSIAGETGAVEEVIGRRFVRDYPAVVATAVSIGVVPAGSVPAGSVPAGSVASGWLGAQRCGAGRRGAVFELGEEVFQGTGRRAHRLDVDTRGGHVAGAVLAAFAGELDGVLGGEGLPVLAHLAGDADRHRGSLIGELDERQVDRARSGGFPCPDVGGSVDTGCLVGPVSVESDQLGRLLGNSSTVSTQAQPLTPRDRTVQHPVELVERPPCSRPRRPELGEDAGDGATLGSRAAQVSSAVRCRRESASRRWPGTVMPGAAARTRRCERSSRPWTV